MQQHDDKKNTARPNQFRSKNILELEICSQFPDINPVEQDLKLTDHRLSLFSLTELELFSKDRWAKISKSHGLTVVIGVKGDSIKYQLNGG